MEIIIIPDGFESSAKHKEIEEKQYKELISILAEYENNTKKT